MTGNRSTRPKGTTMNPHDGNDNEFDFLTIDEAAALLRIPVATLRWYRSVGQGPRSFKLGRRVHYDKQELRNWVAAQRGEGTDDRRPANPVGTDA
jgi:predicted DNA-binding transcriptional regulator AlpA